MRFEDKDLAIITSHLQDDISKAIYANRILFSLTGDYGFLRNVCMTIPETRDFVAWVNANNDKELILFGAGRWGKWISETFDNINWTCFSDNKLIDQQINGLRIIDTKELISNHKNAAIIITAKYHWKEIFNQLTKAGFLPNQLYCFGEVITHVESKIYFDLPTLPRKEDELFVDAGAFDGMTSFEFFRWCNNKGKAFVFEPDEISQKKCLDLLKTNHDFELIPKGVWSEETVLSFELSGSESQVVETGKGSVQIPVTTIDLALNKSEVTFIKMDIEGSELKALIGAEETIRKYKPKLAISIYHKSEDLVTIPKLLLDYNPSYKFWIRHYSMAWFDTVLYAVDGEVAKG